jgi:hypothetical protein
MGKTDTLGVYRSIVTTLFCGCPFVNGFRRILVGIVVLE